MSGDIPHGWDICVDCIDPLTSHLEAAFNAWAHRPDDERQDPIDDHELLSRLVAVEIWFRYPSYMKPPTPDVALATAWMEMNVSVDFSKEWSKRIFKLLAAVREFIRETDDLFRKHLPPAEKSELFGANLVSLPPRDVCEQIDTHRASVVELFERTLNYLRNVSSLLRSTSTIRQSTKPTAPITNGPMAPNVFHWNGKPSIELPSKQFQMLSFLWRSPNRQAKIVDVVEAVWARDNVPDTTVKSIQSRLNRALEQAEFPLNVTSKSGYMRLEIDGF